MSTCSRCGNPIEFRYIEGRCTPIHPDGGCTGYGVSGVNDYAGYNVSYESTCFSTDCPECEEEVYFLRHNGGSVWIDPPLGMPWYKHQCFDDGQSSEQRSSLELSYGITENIPNGKSKRLVIGVTKSTYVDYSKEYTDVILVTARNESREIKVKNNAGFLLGKLCVHNLSTAEIWPAEEPVYVFTVLDPVKVECPELINCPECKVLLNPKNLIKHLNKQHGIN